MGMGDKMTAACAGLGVFIKAIETHFNPSAEMTKIKTAMVLLSELGKPESYLPLPCPQGISTFRAPPTHSTYAVSHFQTMTPHTARMLC